MTEKGIFCDSCSENSCCWREFGLQIVEMAKKIYSTVSRVRELRSPCGRVKDVKGEF